MKNKVKNKTSSACVGDPLVSKEEIVGGSCYQNLALYTYPMEHHLLRPRGDREWGPLGTRLKHAGPAGRTG